MNSNAAIQKADFSRFARTLFISDIQGHLPLLDRLLTTVGFCPDDALVLVGDLIEKGAHNLETLHYIMQLTHSGNVWCVAGNCETELLARLEPENAEDLRLYMDLRQPDRSLLWDMNAEAGLGDLYKRDILSFQQTIKKHIRAAGLESKNFTAQDLRDTAVATILRSISHDDIPFVLDYLGYCSRDSAARFASVIPDSPGPSYTAAMVLQATMQNAELQYE